MITVTSALKPTLKGSEDLVSRGRSRNHDSNVYSIITPLNPKT